MEEYKENANGFTNALVIAFLGFVVFIVLGIFLFCAGDSIINIISALQGCG